MKSGSIALEALARALRWRLAQLRKRRRPGGIVGSDRSLLYRR
jgi:hypothetical protein